MSEAWLNQEQNDSVEIEGYEMYYEQERKKGGGAAVYINKYFTRKLLTRCPQQ